MKFLRNSVITLLILAGIIVAAGLIVERYYGDTVKGAVIDRLNDRLNAEVQVEEVNFSALRKFPFASVELSEVTLQNRGQKKDTLFHFAQVFLQFDLFDLLRGEQRIERVSFENGALDLTIDRNGDHPYRELWRTDPATPDTASSAFELERLVGENIEFEFQDLRTGHRFRTSLSYAFFQGRFEATSSELRAQVEGTWDSFSTPDRTWEELEKSFSLHTSGQIDQEAERIAIEEGEITWNELQGNAEGTIDYGDDASLGLSFEFPFQGAQNYLTAWPDASMPEGYSSKGSIRLKGEWKGSMGPGESPVLSSRIEFKKSSITHESSGIGAEGLKGKGKFTTSDENGRIRIGLEEFGGRFGGGEWEGKGHWSPGRVQRFKIQLKGKSDVARTLRFLNIDTLGTAEGDWNASLKVEGRKRELGEWSPKDLDHFSVNGRAELNGGILSFKEKDYRFEAVDGTFILHDKDAAVEGLTGKVMGSDFHLNGRFHNLLPYLFFPEEELRVEAALRSERIDLDRLLTQDESEGQGNEEDYELKFPEKLHFSLDAKVGELNFRRFHAERIEGRIELGPGGLRARRISLGTAGGRLNGTMAVSAGANAHSLRANAHLKGISIQPFFREFENFGQELVRSEHLRGKLDAQVNYSSALEADLGIPARSVQSTGDIEVRKGELIGFRPLIGLGEELASKKVLSTFLELERLRDELEHVRFKTLQNQLRIEDEELIIPSFDVNSNAVDITASGTHSFDGRIDYRFEILMDELLSKPKESEFGYLRDEGRKKRLFVEMKGTSEDPEIGLDREAAREHRQERRKEEKEEVKDALRKEFGLFKKDSTEQDGEEGEEDKGKPVFDVQWGEEKEEKEEEEGGSEEEEGKSIWERLGIGSDEEEEEKKD